MSSPAKQILFKAHYSVQSFFFIRYRTFVSINDINIVFKKQFKFEFNFTISGLLTTYITFKYTEGKYEKFSKTAFLIMRFIRLTPQLAIFILLSTLIPLLGSGPVWKQQVLAQVNNCYDNWWQNLIYLQTFINVENMV